MIRLIFAFVLLLVVVVAWLVLGAVASSAKGKNLPRVVRPKENVVVGATNAASITTDDERLILNATATIRNDEENDRVDAVRVRRRRW